MKKLLIIVSGGVADYVTDDNDIEVTIFDEDMLKSGDIDADEYKTALSGFEHLTPDWITKLINS